MIKINMATQAVKAAASPASQSAPAGGDAAPFDQVLQGKMADAAAETGLLNAAVPVDTEDDSATAASDAVVQDPAALGLVPILPPPTAAAAVQIKGADGSAQIAALQADASKAATNADQPDPLLSRGEWTEQTADIAASSGRLVPLDGKQELGLLDAAGSKVAAADSAMASQMLHQAPSAGKAQAPVQAAVLTPVQNPGWGQELGQRLGFLVHQGHQVAELQLNPPHLGPIEVRMSIQNDQASIQFSSPHAAVREAIQAASGRLQDMLGGQGMQGVEVQVGSQSLFQQQQQQQQAQAGRDGRAGTEGAASFSLPDVDATDQLLGSAGSLVSAPIRLAARGLVDAFI